MGNTATPPTAAEHPGPINSIPVEFFPLPSTVECRLNLNLFSVLVQDYPESQVVEFLVSGFTEGFRVGFVGEVTKGRRKPLTSSKQAESKIDEAIVKELNRGHTKGPFPVPPFSTYHLSPLGGVPKPDGTIRVILDLSSPRGSSINDGISKEAHTVKYAKFDEAVELATKGNSVFMGKRDIRHAFRLCPVHPEDWPLLVYWWRGKYYVDIVLPFGMRSSPFIFNTFADSLEWIARKRAGLDNMLHYLDDYFFTGETEKKCDQSLTQFDRLCESLKIPLAEDKKEGPAEVITFLGIEIDTVHKCCRLPSQKFQRLLVTLKVWESKKQASKRELLSLIGSLSFAAKVVKPGRTFMRRLIDLSSIPIELSDIVTLSDDALEDVKWWSEFASEWNGVAFFQDPIMTSEQLNFFTDASGLGLGGWFQDLWFSIVLPITEQPVPIHLLEFCAVAIAIVTWSDHLANKQVLISTDNFDVVQVWKTGSCKDKALMALVRKLFFFIARKNINVLMTHVPGKENVLADLLSRLQVARFRELHPSARPEPSRISEEAWEFLDMLVTST